MVELDLRKIFFSIEKKPHLGENWLNRALGQSSYIIYHIFFLIWKDYKIFPILNQRVCLVQHFRSKIKKLKKFRMPHYNKINVYNNKSANSVT
ncbi:unnamed protein product [Blepharisma stoltei]|uniref:Uncharacterized protein n=1 Tax=Blepharisma stoltei TaxID=1481888 RepID=A0AAU9ICD9_9CILI|nr:unnamed protein product [Blepharisma stoltei]